METTEVIKKYEKKFNKIRFYIKLLLLLVLGTIFYMQFENIKKIANWIFNSH